MFGTWTRPEHRRGAIKSRMQVVNLPWERVEGIRCYTGGTKVLWRSHSSFAPAAE